MLIALLNSKLSLNLRFQHIINYSIDNKNYKMAAVVESSESMEMSEETATAPNPKSQLPWVEKYRPNSLDELIAHEEIIQILNRLIESNKLPHLLFHGPPGIDFILTVVSESDMHLVIRSSSIGTGENINYYRMRKEDVRRALLVYDS